MNVSVHDIDLLVINNLDKRRLEVVVDGLPLFHGAQLAIDTILVCPFLREGVAKPRCATENGASLVRARTWKERQYPELAGAEGRARLVVLGEKWVEEVWFQRKSGAWQVVFHVGLHCCTFVCFISVGPRSCRSGWAHPFNPVGFAGPPSRVVKVAFVDTAFVSQSSIR